MSMEKRAFRIRRFKLWVPRLQKASRLGRKFKLVESTVFQQKYSFEMATGEEAYIADMPIWWNMYFFFGSIKREEISPQSRFLPVWKKGTRRRYTNREWISPFRYQSGHRLRTWNQQSLYLDPRDSQMTHVMQTGFEVVWKLLEDHRALLDQCAIIMLIKKKLRAKDLAKFMVPFKVVPESSFYKMELNPELDLKPLARHAKYAPRRLERSWRAESNRFVGQREQRIVTPKGTPVWKNPFKFRSNLVVENAPKPYMFTLPVHLDRMTSQLKNINQDLDQLMDALAQQMPGITSISHTNTMPVLDPNLLQALEERFGITLRLPEPSRCRKTTVSTSPSGFLNEVLPPLDPCITPAKQLEHISVQAAYATALLPLIETVQNWILRWSRQEMHVFDLFWMLIPLDAIWKLPNDRDLPTGMTVHQLLCTEPARYSWFLMSNPDNVLWGQDVPHEQIQAWTEFCHKVKVNMDKRLGERQCTMGSDFLNDLVLQEFPSVTFETAADMNQDTAIRILDLADQWLQISCRHQSMVHFLCEHMDSLDFQEAKKLRNMWQRIITTEKEFVENVPTLRMHMCQDVGDVVRKYRASVSIGRQICAYAANRFYALEDTRQLPLETE